MKTTLIGKAKTNDVWLHSSGEWTNNLFLAEKYEPNDAALLVTAMKKEGIECHTEPVMMAAKRERDSYVKEA
jgi:hypothetical protein